MQATRLIMAHMCKEPFRVAVWPLVAMAVQVRGSLGALGAQLASRCSGGEAARRGGEAAQ